MTKFARSSISRWLLWPGLALCAVLAGCASVKFEGAEQPLGLSPQQVALATAPVQGTVVWGGRIVAIENLEDGTEFQVLAVPLNGNNVPQLDEPSIGRFIAVYRGFLEPEDYAPGRFVTLAGRLDGTVDGTVGEAPVRYALVRTSQVHLWPRDLSSWNPSWNIGVGIGIDL